MNSVFCLPRPAVAGRLLVVAKAGGIRSKGRILKGPPRTSASKFASIRSAPAATAGAPTPTKSSDGARTRSGTTSRRLRLTPIQPRRWQHLPTAWRRPPRRKRRSPLQASCAWAEPSSDADRLAACTAVIDAGEVTGRTLATAYCNRGHALTEQRRYDRAMADQKGRQDGRSFPSSPLRTLPQKHIAALHR